MSSATLFVSLAVAAMGCPSQADDSSPVPSSTEPSPNASILPAPLRPAAVVGYGSAGLETEVDTGQSPPEPLREDAPLAPDTEEFVDPSGLTLQALFRWHGLPQSPSGPEVDASAVAFVRQKTLRTMVIDLSSAGRMRLRLGGLAFPLPPGTELRSRRDRLGHVLVWPDGQSYRILQPGVLRALFQEGRADVGPLSLAEVRQVNSIRVLGLTTVSREVATPLGKATVHQVEMPGSGSGELLCRALVELVAARPATPACSADLVPVRVEYSWTEGGRLTFEVTTIVSVPELDTSQLVAPPHTPSFKADRLPVGPAAQLLDESTLRTLRKRDGAPSEDAEVPEGGFVAVNHAETARYLLVDGVPVARVLPHSQAQIALRPGRYALSWIDFLGAQQEPARHHEAPARDENAAGAVSASTPSP